MQKNNWGAVKKKKILIITYYWPPAGGPGVQRWLKFVKYLPQFNIEPIVYIPENATYPLIDSALNEEVNENLTILSTPIREPYRFAKVLAGKKSNSLSAGMIPNEHKQSGLERLLLWIRGNLFIPDARVGWVKPSVKYLSEYLNENRDIEIVITTGPPHSLHLIGEELQRLCKVKWIADFRDPWTTIGYHKQLKLSDRAGQSHLAMEKRILQSADHIITTSKSTKQEFETKTHRPISVITNGYDVVNLGKIILDEKFTLSHIGSLLPGRNPRVLWKAISELRKENTDFKTAFQLKLAGKVSDEIKSTLNEFKLEDCVLNLGYVSNEEALRQMRSSQVLLLIEIDSEETKAIIPGKLFEYMAAERPILGIGPEGADFFEIIKQTNTGKTALYNQKEKIKEILSEYFSQYQQKQLKAYAMGLQYFSRYKLTEKLSGIINNL